MLFFFILILAFVIFAISIKVKQETKQVNDITNIKSINNRSGLSDVHLPNSKKEAELMVPQWLKIVEDSAKLVNTTKNPETFFSRYDLMLDTAERLAYCERFVTFSGEPPSVFFIKAETSKPSNTKLFIDRFAQDTRIKMYNLSTKKGKENKAKAFYDTMTEFSDKMANESILYVDKVYGTLLNIVNE